MTMGKKRIGILTGGGDVPGGLNTVIKTVTYRSSENNIEVIGFRHGWEALTHLNLDDPASRRRYIIALDRENTRTIDRRGGTVLHSSRTNPSKMQKLPDHLAADDFPVSLSSKGGIDTKIWDLFSRRSALHTSLRSAVTTRSVTPKHRQSDVAALNLPVIDELRTGRRRDGNGGGVLLGSRKRDGGARLVVIF
jgi:Phosphofructokinase